MRRLANAVVGFLAGVCTAPLAAITWPFVAAWFLWHETDEEESREAK